MRKGVIYTPNQLLWLRISSSMRYFLVGVVGTVSMVPSDIISTHATSIATICMTVLVLLLKSLDRAVGVSDEDVQVSDAAAQDRPE